MEGTEDGSGGGGGGGAGGGGVVGGGARGKEERKTRGKKKMPVMLFPYLFHFFEGEIDKRNRNCEKCSKLFHRHHLYLYLSN